MMPAMMTYEEAFDRACAELEPRSNQVSAAEFNELVQDRVAELLGRPKLARLSGGRRLNAEEFMQLSIAVSNFISDYEHVAYLGEARFFGEHTLAIMFRLKERPDIGYTIEVKVMEGVMTLTEAGQHAAVKLYDTLTPTRVEQLIKAKPIS